MAGTGLLLSERARSVSSARTDIDIDASERSLWVGRAIPFRVEAGRSGIGAGQSLGPSAADGSRCPFAVIEGATLREGAAAALKQSAGPLR